MTKREQHTIYVCDTCGIEISSNYLPKYWFTISIDSGIKVVNPPYFNDYTKPLCFKDSRDFCSIHCLEIYLKAFIEETWSKACLEVKPEEIDNFMKLNNKPKPFNYEINRMLLEESKKKKNTKRK